MLKRLFLIPLVLLLATPTSAPAQASVDFARDIQPLLSARCVRCHGPKKQEGGLRLDVRRRAFLGGDTGPAVVAKSGPDSVLLQRVTAPSDEKRMPPSGEPLTAAEVALLRTWIEQGAAWPDALAGKEDYDRHWAFRPIARPDVPRLKDAARVQTPIDAFVLAKLEAKGMTLAPRAEPRTLLRRLYLDLVGLPPTVREGDDFLHAHTSYGSHRAYVELVDRLLASPHFGERWGRHWLDLARYAESDGYENDRIRTDAFRFRDWVIAAVNRDVPFDQFTIEQLAGDLLPGATPEQKAATGFHRNTLYNSAASGDKEEFRVKAVKDRVDTTGTTWMGLTLGCAQCHSHKYDPIAQREYYQLFAFFNNTDEQSTPFAGGPAPALREVKRASHIFKRGNYLEKGALVTPLTPAFLPPLEPRGQTPDRLDLARWLVRPDHPLTARVAVNHIWQHLFGQGLVTTPENFGTNGNAPSHPELLDWLASEFVRLGWSRKALIRTMVMSEMYQQASSPKANNVSLGDPDPDNVLLARQNRFRVEAEIVRDLALSVSGLLDCRLGGPSIVPPFPDGLLAQNVTAEALKMPTPQKHRRGIYIHVQRTLTMPSLLAFDVADGNQTCPRRERSTTPLQALTLLNDPAFLEAAEALGARLQKLSPERDERLRGGFQLCLGRPPSAQELAVLVVLVDRQQRLGANDRAIWTGVARTLLNLDEFITRE